MARKRMLAPINSVKHIVPRAVTTVVTAAIVNDVIVDSVVASAVNLANEVLEGSIIKAVSVEIWAAGTAAPGSSTAFNMTVEKIPANAPKMTNAQSLNLMTYPNKKNILYTTQGLLSSQSGSNFVPLFKQWIAIPKGKQRFGLGDQLVLNFSNIATNDYLLCGIYIYKEYR